MFRFIFALMIAFLSGQLVYKSPALVHLKVNGVGYEIHISLHTYSKIQGMTDTTLLTHLIIREDAHLLYGFADESEKQLFIHLLSVSGVGASTARMMLSAQRPEEIIQAIAQSNVKLLESIKGIGKKTAERLVLELRDKVQKLTTVENLNISPLGSNSFEDDALNALIALGIAKPMAEKALIKAKASVGSSDPDLQTLIKEALKLV